MGSRSPQKADYRVATSVLTPWGDSTKLREQKINPGLGVPREEVERSQRARLYGAMVAVVAEKGYVGTTVADLLALSGVSRATFYRFFRDKEDCFVATVRALLARSAKLSAREYQGEGEGDWEERAQRALRAFMEILAEQSAAARLCYIESYVAGPRALRPLGDAATATAQLLAATFEQQPGRAGTPLELARAMVGGFSWVIYQHLKDGREGELAETVPELWEWALSYEPPPQPLRVRSRRPSATVGGAPPFAAHVPRERVLRGFAAAVAENGYGETTIAAIAARAQISQQTFYAHFDGKEDAMFAAIESAGAQMVATALPALRRAKSGPAGVRTALESIFGFLAAEPDFARLLAFEAFAAGPAAIERRDQTITEVVEVSLGLGLLPRGARPIAQQATVGAIAGVVFDCIWEEKVDELLERVPLATYIALAPFVGAERAAAAARGELEAR
jgi:AcrR family transcriptional regulator